MRIPDKLKLNRFQAVRVPSPKEVMQIHGFRSPDDSMFSGDNEGDSPMNKTEALDKAYNDLSKMCDDMAKKDENNDE